MIVFIGCGFLRPSGFFGNTQNCGPMLLPSPSVSCKESRREDAMSHADQCSLEALASLQMTPREAEVLFWISQGKSNHDIGVILGAKTGTICKHVEHIFAKLNVENRTAAAFVALEDVSAPPRRRPKVNLVRRGMRLPVLLQRSSVRYARMIPTFTANSCV